MSAFDDEFGLFGDEAEEDQERRSTLGARNIASGGETIINDVDPEEERQPRRQPSGEGGRRTGTGNRGGGFPRPGGGRGRVSRGPADPVASQKRAAELLAFLAKRLVTNADAVAVDSFAAEGGEPPALELVVDPEDLGKVIGRNGRVAQALRTIVRATAEGRLSVDIYDTEEIAASQAEYESEDGK